MSAARVLQTALKARVSVSGWAVDRTEEPLDAGPEAR